MPQNLYIYTSLVHANVLMYPFLSHYRERHRELHEGVSFDLSIYQSSQRWKWTKRGQSPHWQTRYTCSSIFSRSRCLKQPLPSLFLVAWAKGQLWDVFLLDFNPIKNISQLTHSWRCRWVSSCIMAAEGLLDIKISDMLTLKSVRFSPACYISLSLCKVMSKYNGYNMHSRWFLSFSSSQSLLWLRLLLRIFIPRKKILGCV